jgi:hypothetical protein
MLDKISYNKIGQFHGMWEVHSNFLGGRLTKGFFVNNVDYGFWIESTTKLIYYAR